MAGSDAPATLLHCCIGKVVKGGQRPLVALAILSSAGTFDISAVTLDAGPRSAPPILKP